MKGVKIYLLFLHIKGSGTGKYPEGWNRTPITLPDRFLKLSFRSSAGFVSVAAWMGPAQQNKSVRMRQLNRSGQPQDTGVDTPVCCFPATRHCVSFAQAREHDSCAGGTVSGREERPDGERSTRIYVNQRRQTAHALPQQRPYQEHD